MAPNEMSERYGPNWADVARVVDLAKSATDDDLHLLSLGGGSESATLHAAGQKAGRGHWVRHATDDAWMASAHLTGPYADRARYALCAAAAAHVLADVIKPLVFRNATLGITRAYPEGAAA